MEEWKQIDGYDRYEISSFGNVRRNGKVLNFQRCGGANRDYLAAGLYKDGVKKTITIHRLVALAFIPNPDNKRTVDHINRNKLDNTVANLRWATDSEQGVNRHKELGVLGQKYIVSYKDGFRISFVRDHLTLRSNKINTLEEAIEFRDKFISTVQSD